jgi:hypothetical protein
MMTCCALGDHDDQDAILGHVASRGDRFPRAATKNLTARRVNCCARRNVRHHKNFSFHHEATHRSVLALSIAEFSMLLRGWVGVASDDDARERALRRGTESRTRTTCDRLARQTTLKPAQPPFVSDFQKLT